MNKSIIPTDEDVNAAYNGLQAARIDPSNPIFDDPQYYVKGKYAKVGRDAAGQDTVEMIFEVLAKPGASWDTADSLYYLTRVVWALKNLTECARVRMNYDTAHSSMSIPRHTTVNVTYVLSSKKLEEGKKVLLGESIAMKLPG